MSSAKRKGILACSLLSLAAAGCDLSGQYEKRFVESIQAANIRAVFDQQLFATETPVTDAESTRNETLTRD